MERMTTYNSPQMTRRYPNGQLRIVTYEDINEGDEIVFKNENWMDEKRVVSKIHEKRPSLGDFTGFETPTSYRLN